MLNLYDYYLKLKEEDVIFSYRGKITGELMEGIYRMMDVQDSASRADDVKKKKLNYLLVECCQNVIKHSVKGEDDSILVIARNEEDSYLIYTGNIIEKLEVSEIENKINEINLMSADELREFYRLKLDRKKAKNS